MACRRAPVPGRIVGALVVGVQQPAHFALRLLSHFLGRGQQVIPEVHCLKLLEEQVFQVFLVHSEPSTSSRPPVNPDGPIT